MSETRKILLLEDRPGRQSQFLNQEQVKSLKEMDFLYFPSSDECVNMISQINEKTADLIQFQLIIVHKSSLLSYGLNYLKSLKKDLILFSGGISQMVYLNEDFPILSINSADLYISNFINFLKKYNKGEVKNLTELLYGNRWKSGVLPGYRHG